MSQDERPRSSPGTAGENPSIPSNGIRGRTRTLSPEAKATIDARVEATRWPIFRELCSVIKSRGGEIDEAELIVAGAVVAQLVGAEDIAVSMLDALGEAGVGLGQIRKWLDSSAGQKLLARAAADSADGHPMVMRPDYSIKHIVQTFGINAEEEEKLDLRFLVSERRRSMLRRRAEGIPAKADKRPTSEKPWEALGISKSTYYERKNREKVIAAKRVAGRKDNAVGQPWKILGVSKATYYRRNKQAGETNRRTETDPTPITFSSYYNNPVAESPAPGLVYPPASLYRTAEARRFRAFAISLGMSFDWTVPNALFRGWDFREGQSTPEKEGAFRRAKFDVERAELRYDAMKNAAHRREMERKAREAGKPIEEYGFEVFAGEKAAEKSKAVEGRAAILRGEKSPHEEVPMEVWSVVPAHAREEVYSTAFRMFALIGCSRIAAVLSATELVCRRDAIWAGLGKITPAIDLAFAQRIYRYFANYPTDAAVSEISERSQRARQILDRVLESLPDAELEVATKFAADFAVTEKPTSASLTRFRELYTAEGRTAAEKRRETIIQEINREIDARYTDLPDRDVRNIRSFAIGLLGGDDEDVVTIVESANRKWLEHKEWRVQRPSPWW